VIQRPSAMRSRAAAAPSPGPNVSLTGSRTLTYFYDSRRGGEIRLMQHQVNLIV